MTTAHASRSLRGNVDRNANKIISAHSLAVVPYVGTWIEIRIRRLLCPAIPVVPYVGTWIEIGNGRSRFDEIGGRSLRGNVDRNSWLVSRAATMYVVPYVGTWIEILHRILPFFHRASFPTWERG